MSNEKVNELLDIDDSYKAPDAIWKILKDKDRRQEVFMQFLHEFDMDVNYDWFHDYFQDEHADRKNKKQDFTPTSVGKLLAELMQDDEIKNWNRYEPCAGTGGITIQTWHKDRLNNSPLDYKPSWYFYHCEELSDRAIPFLLFNLMIRGMNAVVVQCDVLSREASDVFFVQNDRDDHLQFSNLYSMPYSEEVASSFGIKWKGEKEFEYIDMPGELPKHIFGDVTLEQLKKIKERR